MKVIHNKEWSYSKDTIFTFTLYRKGDGNVLVVKRIITRKGGKSPKVTTLNSLNYSKDFIDLEVIPASRKVITILLISRKGIIHRPMKTLTFTVMEVGKGKDTPERSLTMNIGNIDLKNRVYINIAVLSLVFATFIYVLISDIQQRGVLLEADAVNKEIVKGKGASNNALKPKSEQLLSSPITKIGKYYKMTKDGTILLNNPYKKGGLKQVVMKNKGIEKVNLNVTYKNDGSITVKTEESKAE